MFNPGIEPQASVQPIEPEDPKNNAQAAQRSALDEKQKENQPNNLAEVAGQHATGSFVEKK
jgi:hypothetical protein